MFMFHGFEDLKFGRFLPNYLRDEFPVRILASIHGEDIIRLLGNRFPFNTFVIYNDIRYDLITVFPEPCAVTSAPSARTVATFICASTPRIGFGVQRLQSARVDLVIKLVNCESRLAFLVGMRVNQVVQKACKLDATIRGIQRKKLHVVINSLGLL
ncbi:hypothetical protein BC826DRAFT_1048534 [Russula brevipes]|nr:hypothetical protein BC826DRAFT_1048534 [Russula brevipes]